MRAALELVFSLIWLCHAGRAVYDCALCALGRGQPVRPASEEGRHSSDDGEEAPERPQTLGEHLSEEAIDLLNLATIGVEIIFWVRQLHTEWRDRAS